MGSVISTSENDSSSDSESDNSSPETPQERVIVKKPEAISVEEVKKALEDKALSDQKAALDGPTDSETSDSDSTTTDSDDTSFFGDSDVDSSDADFEMQEVAEIKYDQENSFSIWLFFHIRPPFLILMLQLLNIY